MPGAEMTAIAITLMALTTYVARVLGVWLLAGRALPPLTQRFLQHLGVGMIAALVVPSAINGDKARLLGVVIAAGLMIVIRKPILCLALGVILTAVLRLPLPLPAA